MKQRLTILLLLTTAPPACAQGDSDFLGWYGARVAARLPASPWSAEATYQYLTYERASRYYLDFGALYVSYKLRKSGVQFSPGYVRGSLDQLGRAHVLQARVLQQAADWRLRPQWRVTADRLWLQFPPEPPATGFAAPVYRVRLLLGIEPKLSDTWSAQVNTEPFLYRAGKWGQELRSQAGLKWQAWPRGGLELKYFNRWVGYSPARVRWEHAVIVLVGYQIGGGENVQ